MDRSFDLDLHDGKSRESNLRELFTFLKRYGEYPEKYRLQIWRYLMRLPLNKDTYERLANRGLHPAYVALAEKYPIKDGRLLRQLQQLLSALAHWSPIFAEAPFLPALVFPLVKLVPQDAVLRFEIAATVLTNWCGRYYEFYPNPPFTLLNEVDDLLEHHCPALLQHFVKLGATAQVYAWLPLQSLFSECLSKFEWLRLMDHTVSNDTAFLVFFTVAYCMSLQRTLRTAASVTDVEFFMRRPSTVDLSAVLKLTYRLIHNTPSERLPSRSEVIPLPRGAYPIFDKYPEFTVNYQAAERERIAREEQLLKEKRQEMETMKKRMERLTQEEEAWRRQHEQAMRMEQELSRTAAEEQARRLEEMRRLDLEHRQQRLKYLEQLAEARRNFAMQSAQTREAELRRLETEIQRRKQTDEYQIGRRLEEEDLLRAEVEAVRRMQEFKLSKEHESAMAHLRAQAEARQKHAEASTAEQEEKWRQEDEQWRAQLQQWQEKQDALFLLNEQQRVRREMEAKLALAEAERRLKLERVEHARQLRKTTDLVSRAQQETQRDQMMASEVLDVQSATADRLLDAEQQAQLKRAESERQRALDQAQRTMMAELERRNARLRELEEAQQRLALQEQFVRRKGEVEAELAQRERELADAMLKMEEERRKDAELERELVFKQTLVQDKLEFAKRLREVELEVAARERQRFEQLRKEMRRAHEAELAQLTRRHEEALAALQQQRAQEVEEAARGARQRVASDAAQALQAEQQDLRDRMIRERVALAERENDFVRRMVEDAERLTAHIPTPSTHGTDASRILSPTATVSPAPPPQPRQPQPSQSPRQSKVAAVAAAAAPAAAQPTVAAGPAAVPAVAAIAASAGQPPARSSGESMGSGPLESHPLDASLGIGGADDDDDMEDDDSGLWQRGDSAEIGAALGLDEDSIGLDLNSEELGESQLAELQATAQRLIAQHRSARAALTAQ